MVVKKDLLKNIPVEKWNVIRINNPWLNYNDTNSLIKKIIDSGLLITGNFKFTQTGLDKIKQFVDNNWPFRLYSSGTRMPLKSLNTSHDIDNTVDGLSKQDNVGRVLEAGQILKEGEFISREAFDFMVWMMGNQEVEYQEVVILNKFKTWLGEDLNRTNWQNNLEWEKLWNFFEKNKHEHWKKYVNYEGNYEVELDSQNAEGLKQSFSKWWGKNERQENNIDLQAPKPTNVVSDVPVGQRINLAYYPKIISRNQREALKGRLAILENSRTYRKLIKNTDPRNWSNIQFLNDNSPFRVDDKGASLTNDYHQWTESYPSRWQWSSNFLFKTGTSSARFSMINEGVIHYLREKYGEREITVFYGNGVGETTNLPHREYFVDEFLNDENAYLNGTTPANDFWVHLSTGSGNLINLRLLNGEQRKALQDRRIIVWDGLNNHKKLWKNVKTDNLGRLQVVLPSFFVFAKQISEASKLLTVDNCFASQELLDEWKQLVNQDLKITPIDIGQEVRLGDLTTNHRLQGGSIWSIAGVSDNYQTQNALEVVVASLMANNNTIGSGSGTSHRFRNEKGYNFVKKVIKPSDWEKIEAEVDYRRFHRIQMEEFMDDDIENDFRVFLIDEDRAVVSSRGEGTVDDNLVSQITNLTQKIDSLQTQLTTQQEQCDKCDRYKKERDKAKQERDKEYEQLNKEIDKWREASLVSVNSEVESKLKEVLGLTLDVDLPSDWKEQIERWKNDTTKQVEEIAVLTSKKNEKEREIIQLKEKVKFAQEEKGKVERKFAEIKAKNEQLEEAQSDLERAKNKLKTAEESKEKADEELRKLKTKYDALSRNLSGLTIPQTEKEAVKKHLKDYMELMDEEIKGTEGLNESEKELFQAKKQQYEAKIVQVRPFITKINNWGTKK